MAMRQCIKLLQRSWIGKELMDPNGKRKWKDTFSSGFRKADDQVVSKAIASEMVGSTAVVAVVSGCQVILFICWDSWAVFSRRMQTVPLTVDLKPHRAIFENRRSHILAWC